MYQLRLISIFIFISKMGTLVTKKFNINTSSWNGVKIDPKQLKTPYIVEFNRYRISISCQLFTPHFRSKMTILYKSDMYFRNYCKNLYSGVISDPISGPGRLIETRKNNVIHFKIRIPYILLI